MLKPKELKRIDVHKDYVFSNLVHQVHEALNCTIAYMQKYTPYGKEYMQAYKQYNKVQDEFLKLVHAYAECVEKIWEATLYDKDSQNEH